MLFFAGIFFVVVGFISFGSFYRTSKRPRINNARVLELTKEPYKYHSSSRNFPHALVEYNYENATHQKKILLHTKVEIGDLVDLYVDSSRPDDVEHYYPKKQIAVGFAIIAIGLGMMLGSLILSDLI